MNNSLKRTRNVKDLCSYILVFARAILTDWRNNRRWWNEKSIVFRAPFWGRCSYFSLAFWPCFSWSLSYFPARTQRTFTAELQNPAAQYKWHDYRTTHHGTCSLGCKWKFRNRKSSLLFSSNHLQLSVGHQDKSLLQGDIWGWSGKVMYCDWIETHTTPTLSKGGSVSLQKQEIPNYPLHHRLLTSLLPTFREGGSYPIFFR